MEVLFLGTSSMVPTKERNHSSILVSCRNESILVDCGEGTQRQLKIAGIKLTKITKILISHWHGDHVLGLPGLIQSMGASDYRQTLHIYGPKGIKENISRTLNLFVFEKKFEIVVEEARGRFFSGDVVLECTPLHHGIPSLGYSIMEADRRKINLEYTKKIGIPQGPLLGKLQSGKSIMWKGKRIGANKATNIVKGKKITIISDTLPCREAEKLAKASNLLVCESTYSSEMEAKAKDHMHMTSSQAAKLAKTSNSERLTITHFSSRYKDAKILEKEAKSVFKNASAANDFMKIKI